MESKPTYRVKLWAFFLSLTLSPLLIAAGSLGVFMISNSERIGLLIAASFSLILVSAPYIILGWPALFIASKRRPPAILYWGMVGLIANVAAPLVSTAITAALAGRVDMIMFQSNVEIAYTLGFAAMFVWCAFAAILYRLLAGKPVAIEA